MRLFDHVEGKMNYTTIILSLLTAASSAHALPSMNELLGRLKQIEAPKISFAQAMPWIGAVGTAGAGWGIWSWYKKQAEVKRKQEEVRKKVEAAQEQRKKHEEQIAQMLEDHGIKERYDLLLHALITDFIQDPDENSIELLELVQDKMNEQHSMDKKNNPSSSQVINKQLIRNKKLSLQFAAEKANPKAVKWLLHNGANPKIEIKTGAGMMSLTSAVELAKRSTDHPDGIKRYSEILSDLYNTEKNNHKSEKSSNRSKDYYNKIL